MFKGTDIKPFESKMWLASPTMHGDELKYMTVSYENTEAIRLMDEELVDTYHSSEPLSEEQKKEYSKEIEYILEK